MLLLIIPEHLLSRFMTGPAITQLVQSFSVVFLYWFYVFSVSSL
ncbi:hypothetical protein DAI22_09g044000 [Oryza sativa Japonica Group]|nr:hypothetical protein DAI22_09g044000 [Oryza sativa Japonica Group]